MRATVLLLAALAAQTASPTFEVASVKPNGSGSTLVAGPRVEADRVTATNVNLLVLIQAAYNLNADHIIGGPKWMGSPGPPNGDRFDIAAKASAPFSPRDQWHEMLQSLLIDRFRLTVHWETRPEDIYALVVARSDGKLGPNLHRATMDCAALRAAAQKNDPTVCGDTFRFGVTGRMNARGFKLDQLLALGLDAGRRIVNKTELDGVFDWDLTFTPRAFANRQVDLGGPSLFTALEEQLGLKLVPEKDPGQFLIIDGVEQPTPD